MKVNISYAVELEDVPLEVGKLVTTAAYQMSMALESIEELSTANPTSAVEEINKIREKLKDLDLRLSDCSNILSGYIGLQNKSSIDTATIKEGEEDESSI